MIITQLIIKQLMPKVQGFILMFLMLAQHFCKSLSQIQTCACLNGGQCIQTYEANACSCDQNYLGELCQIEAVQLSQTAITANITQQFSYFYLTFSASTLYYVQFMLCSLKPQDTTAFAALIEYQNQNGSITDNPAQVNLFPFSTYNSQCLSIKFIVLAFRKLFNGKFLRLVLRVKSLPQISQQKHKNSTRHQQSEPSRLNLTSVKYQFYEINGFINIKEFLVIFSASCLAISIISFVLCRIMHRRQRRQLSNQNTDRLNNISHFQTLMPACNFLRGTLNDQRECMICLLSVQDELVRVTPCRHVFHKDCIDQWGKKKMNCPVCRKNLSNPSQILEAELISVQ